LARFSGRAKNKQPVPLIWFAMVPPSGVVNSAAAIQALVRSSEVGLGG